MAEIGVDFDLESHKPNGWDDWWEEWQGLQLAMSKAGLAKTYLPSALAVPDGYVSNLKKAKVGPKVTYHSKIAAKISKGLRQDVSIRSESKWCIGNIAVSKSAAEAWEELHDFRHRQANALEKMVEDERVAQTKREVAQLNARGADEAASAPQPVSPAVAPPVSRPILAPGQSIGRTTGLHKAWIDELFSGRAEWQFENRGPDEDPWLLISAEFYEAEILEHKNLVRLPIHLDSLRCYVNLDGAIAKSRHEWDEHSVNSSDVLHVNIMPAASEDGRPVYMMRNPQEKSPLAGRFGFFLLCEVSGPVGQNAAVEFYTVLDGLTIHIPEEIRDRLDPARPDEFKVPEHRLLHHWMRTRSVPLVVDGGLYCLQAIKLNKEQSADA